MLNEYPISLLLIDRDETFKTKKSAGLPPIIQRLVSSPVCRGGGSLVPPFCSPPSLLRSSLDEHSPFAAKTATPLNSLLSFITSHQNSRLLMYEYNLIMTRVRWGYMGKAGFIFSARLRRRYSSRCPTAHGPHRHNICLNLLLAIPIYDTCSTYL